MSTTGWRHAARLGLWAANGVLLVLSALAVVIAATTDDMKQVVVAFLLACATCGMGSMTIPALVHLKRRQLSPEAEVIRVRLGGR